MRKGKREKENVYHNHFHTTIATGRLPGGYTDRDNGNENNDRRDATVDIRGSDSKANGNALPNRNTDARRDANTYKDTGRCTDCGTDGITDPDGDADQSAGQRDAAG